MRHLFIIAAVIVIAESRPALLFTQPLQTAGVEYANVASGVHPHPAVELNAASEAQLPPELLKSHAFYSNPAIAAGLANESWLTKKESVVIDREAEKIPRQKIYEIIKHAGFLDQQ